MYVCCIKITFIRSRWICISVPYFRVLHLRRFIVRKNAPLATNFTIAMARLWRQWGKRFLSDYKVAVNFWNCLSGEGEKWTVDKMLVGTCKLRNWRRNFQLRKSEKLAVSFVIRGNERKQRLYAAERKVWKLSNWWNHKLTKNHRFHCELSARWNISWWFVVSIHSTSFSRQESHDQRGFRAIRLRLKTRISTTLRSRPFSCVKSPSVKQKKKRRKRRKKKDLVNAKRTRTDRRSTEKEK